MKDKHIGMGDPFSLLLFTVRLLYPDAQYFILMGGVLGYTQLYSRGEAGVVLPALKRGMDSVL